MNILELKNITLRFPGVLALDNVSLDVKEGEVLGLIGENGAGKSSLMKIIGGIYTPSEGDIYINGQKMEYYSAAKSIEQKIAFVHQELNLANDLSVYENIFLGRNITNKFGLVKKKEMIKETTEYIKMLDLDIDPLESIKNLSNAHKQMVEILKALTQDAKIIILDEPTTSLTTEDVNRLFKIVKMLKKKGCSFIFISHRLPELFEITDRITVLRDGKYISTNDTSKINDNQLIKDMVGRELDDFFSLEHNKNQDGKIVFKNFSDLTGKYQDITFEINRGEIVGFGGLVGSGRTELMEMIFGVREKRSGIIIENDCEVHLKTARQATEHGIALIPEDRRNKGLILDLDVENNINITNLNNKVIKQQECDAIATDYKKLIDIKTPSIRQTTKLLSGGNQQKVVIAKWLNKNSRIYIFDEPTKGIDVGAKKEIYKIMSQLIDEGKYVILISSDMQELLGVSDKIYIMNEGKIVKKLNKLETTQEEIMTYATGGYNEKTN